MQRTKRKVAIMRPGLEAIDSMDVWQMVRLLLKSELINTQQRETLASITATCQTGVGTEKVVNAMNELLRDRRVVGALIGPLVAATRQRPEKTSRKVA